MIRDRVALRMGSRHLPRLTIIISSVVFIFLGIIIWNTIASLPDGRTTIVVAGDPVTVLSWDGERRKLGVITIPGDVRIDGVYGTGQLPLVSLLKLEELDGGKKGLFIHSLSDALGVPIEDVIRDRGPLDTHGAIGSLSPFSQTGWQWEGGLSLPARFHLWWIFKNLRPDVIWSVNLQDQGVFRDTDLADGSGIRVFNNERFDTALGSLLESDSIRREMYRVLIVNTTSATGLGGRVARVLERAGMAVASVENDASPQDGCSVHVEKDLRQSHAVLFIQKTYGCTLSPDRGDVRVDITVRLGGANAKNYRWGQ